MDIKAEQKYIRMSPRKIRFAAAAIRRLPLQRAQLILEQMNQYAATPLRKTLRQAVANAVNNHHLSENSLTIKSIQVSEGATFKRWQPVSRGRAHPILKRTSHIRVILESKEPEKIVPKPTTIKKVPSSTRVLEKNTLKKGVTEGKT